MGDIVYDCGPVFEGAHVFAHSRKDGKEGKAYLVINNSLTDITMVELPKEAEVYNLSGDGKMRSKNMLLTGKPLVLGENDELPPMEFIKVVSGTMEIQPGNCTFILL